MSPAAEPRKMRPRYAAKREAIMEAATQVFCDQGFSGFTLAAVAKRMDLHPVSLTYYFKRKEDLAGAVLHVALARHAAMVDAAEREATPQARLRALIRAYVEVRRRVALGEEGPLAPFSEVRLVGAEGLMEAFSDLYIRLGRLTRSEDAPWMTPARRHALARLLVDHLGWTDAWLGAYAPEDYVRVGERLADILIDGMAPDGAVPPALPLPALGGCEAQNDEVTRESFLTAATSLINREGYRGASVEKISAELKVTKGSFYHHNTDKDELAVACFERSIELMGEARRLALSNGRNGWERLWLWTASLSQLQASAPDGRLLRHYALAAVPPDIRTDVARRFYATAMSLSGLIADGIADGSLRAVDPLLAGQLVLVTFNSARPAAVGDLLQDYVRPALTGWLRP